MTLVLGLRALFVGLEEAGVLLVAALTEADGLNSISLRSDSSSLESESGSSSGLAGGEVDLVFFGGGVGGRRCFGGARFGLAGEMMIDFWRMVVF